MVEIDVTITVSQLQALVKETLRSRPPNPSCFNAERYELDVVIEWCMPTLDLVQLYAY